jgi:putative membrane protein
MLGMGDGLRSTPTIGGPGQRQSHPSESGRRGFTLGRLSAAILRVIAYSPFSTALWLTFTLATPFIDFLTAGLVFPVLASIGVLLQLSAALLVLARAWSLRRVLAVGLTVVMITWVAEWLGTSTGLLFGRYRYTALLQPQIMAVPVLIPLAWMMMLPPAWAIASAVIDPRRRLAFAAFSAVAFTAWDLYLDPQMVARGLWAWESQTAMPFAYYGIPGANFLGWLLTAFLVTLLCAPRDLPTRPLAVIYTLTWLLQAIGLGLFWGQPGPALAGFVGMGVFVAQFWRAAPKIPISPP